MEAPKEEEQGSTINSGAPSASSSPSHEFSFTISLHSSTRAVTTTPETIKHQEESPLAIDLTPADEIFFHGHLLPLHFLSHLHAASATSPRHSTNSTDSFTLPIRDMLHDHELDGEEGHKISTVENGHTHTHQGRIASFGIEPKGRKPFSIFGLSKWRKGSHESNKEKENHRHLDQQQQDHHQNKKKLKFDVSQFVKRYVRMVKPLLSPRGGGGRGRRESLRFRRQTYSFSGTVSPRDRWDLRGRRGEFSAPASMRASPTNSGVLLAAAGAPSPASDSTMEELQAAIQAAIAHCKNSIAAEKKPSQDLSVPVT